jgi:hypothetical protein
MHRSPPERNEQSPVLLPLKNATPEKLQLRKQRQTEANSRKMKQQQLHLRHGCILVADKVK